MTKLELMDEFHNLVISKGKEINKRTHDLHEQKKVTFGWMLTVNIYDNYHYEKLIEINHLNRVKKWDIEYWLKGLKNHIEKSLKEIEEQEKLPFEESQMQVLIREGKIQYM